MRKFIPVTAILLSTLAVGCANRQNEAPETTAENADISNFRVVQTVKSAEKNYLCQGPGDVFGDSLPIYSKVAITVQWPEEMGNKNITPLQDSISAAIFEAPKRSIDETIMAFLNDPEGNDVYKMLPVDSIPSTTQAMILYNAKIASAITFSPQYIVYQIMTSQYKGGAHGISVSRYLNYDFNAERVITAADAFKQDSDETLLNAITTQLMAMYGATSPKDLDKHGIFSDQIFVSPNFYLQGYSVVFHYNPYDIAPYSTGSIDVAVPYYTIKDALTPEVVRLFTLSDTF